MKTISILLSVIAKARSLKIIHRRLVATRARSLMKASMWTNSVNKGELDNVHLTSDVATNTHTHIYIYIYIYI